MSEWQPIETAPRDRRILLCDYEAHEGFWDRDPVAEGGQCWRMAGFDMERVEPTHWMPLPDPPTEEAKNGQA